VGDLVPRTDLPGAVALNSIGFNLSRSVGPAIGGAIVAAVGAAGAFAANALSYVALVLVLLRWRPERTVRTLPRESFGRALGAGLRYVAMSPNLGKVLLRAFAFGIAGGSVLALLPVVASDLLHGGPLTYGLLLGAFGVGAVGGALISGRLHGRLSAEWIVRLAFLGFAVCTWALAVGVSPIIAGAGLAIGGACWVLALSLFNVTVQMSTPRWVVGRALSVYQTCVFGGMASGSWLWGLAGDHFGLQVALTASGVALIAGGLLGLPLPLPPRVELNLDPVNRWQEPHVLLDIQPRSGPIVILVEYLIRPEDVPEFLDLMAQRKRIRQRNGARDWTLTRDLGQPEVWIEQYRTPTWVDYVRHNQRLTHSEAEVVDRIRAMHQGAEPPRVRRMIERPTDWMHVVPAHSTMEPH
jgi:MFS family permease